MIELVVMGVYKSPTLHDCIRCADLYHRGHSHRSLSPFGRVLRDLMLSGL